MQHKPSQPFTPKQYFYSLIIDNSVQWFSYLIKHEEINGYAKICNVIESKQLPDIDDTEVISDIWSRPFSFTSVHFNGINSDGSQSYNGIYISEREFGRIKRLIELYPYVTEFRKLSKYGN